MPKCRKCDVELTPEVNWSKGLIQARTYLCRACNSEKGKLHYQMNSEKALDVRRKRLRDKEAATKDAESKATYYAKNREKWKAYDLKGKQKARSNTWLRSQQMLTWIRSRAGKFGKEFDLDREWIQDRLDNGVCEVTGMKFNLAAELRCRFNPYCPSIDRIDSDIGYLKSNCRAVVWIYNMAKAEWSDEVVMEFAKALVSKNRKE